ncbi:MAG: carbohydrate kinase family protein [Hespellia sp.]|nr:carbohydrate kinase family protein [Hespellia sp.]
MAKDITIIGPAVIDVLASPVTPDVFQIGTQPVKEMKLSFGGDALNESVVLTRLGKQVELVSKLGKDDAGDRVVDYIRNEGLSMDSITREEHLQTSMIIVLVDESGERCFLTNPEGSHRKLSEKDVEPYLDQAADIVSFAGLFISPALDIPATERIFRRIKEKPERILAVDMTKAKNGETLGDIQGLLPYVDYMLPNNEEIALLTGEKDPYINAGLLIDAGVTCAVIKCGSEGCLIRTKDVCMRIPTYPVEHAVDSTGAGDCFAAGFLWGLSQGLSLKECGCFACAVASCTVEKIGATEGVRSLEEPMRRYQKLLTSADGDSVCR